MFFFEKKNQKTFTHLGRCRDQAPQPLDKSFLLLFSKKKSLLHLPPASGPAVARLTDIPLAAIRHGRLS